jgi:hypothetical protein
MSTVVAPERLARFLFWRILQKEREAMSYWSKKSGGMMTIRNEAAVQHKRISGGKIRRECPAALFSKPERKRLNQRTAIFIPR